jgi:PPM family protein phosphatase
VKFGVKSHTGMVREINEDSYNVIAGYPGVPVSFIIADGMGGHNSGEIASKAAVDFISNYILQYPELISDVDDISNGIKEIMLKANEEVYNLSMEQEENYGMGTTLITAVINNQRLFIGHIGDSRVYLIRDGELQRVTTDHSLIEELVANGTLTREEAKVHPNKNVITRALGCDENIQIDTYISNMKDEDIYILCTDGLTNKVSEDEILEVVEKVEDPNAACEELIKKANGNGGEDNITVIVIKNNE